MKKKKYKVPVIKVINLDSCDILAGSGEGNGMENLSRDPFGGETLEQDDDGYVWADAKRQGNRIIDDSEDW